MSTSSSTDIVFLTALDVEYAAVRAHLTNLRREAYKGTQYEVGRFGERGPSVAIVEIGAGNVGAAFEAERAISRFQPSLLLFVGVAGGLKDAQIGDVVVGTKAYGYDTGKDEETLLPRPDIALASYALEQLARAVKRDDRWRARRVVTRFDSRDSFDAFVGPIAAGEKVVASLRSGTYKLIKATFNDALAVEMEAIGTLRAVRANAGLDALVVRGISDLVEDKTASDEEGSQSVASSSAAAFAAELIAQWANQRSESAPLLVDDDDNPLEAPAGFWTDLETLAALLYETGPQHESLWSRAGGDVGALDLSGNGRAKWHRAVQRLQNGGGGTTVSHLVAVMLEDYSDHAGLQKLSEQARAM